MYDIRNELTEKSLPLSDNIHGPYKMMPRELLHTSGSGLLVYMFESVRDQMGGKKERDLIDKQHIDRNCDVLPLSFNDLLNYTTLMLKFCTNKQIWASLLRQVCF